MLDRDAGNPCPRVGDDALDDEAEGVWKEDHGPGVRGMVIDGRGFVAMNGSYSFKGGVRRGSAKYRIKL